MQRAKYLGQNLGHAVFNPQIDWVHKFLGETEGTLSYTWPEDAQDRLTMMGKYDHMREIARHSEDIYAPHVEEIQEELKFWRQLEDFTVAAPSKAK